MSRDAVEPPKAGMSAFDLDSPFGRLVAELVTRDGVEPEVLSPDLLVARPPGSSHYIAIVRDGVDAMRDVAKLVQAGKQGGGIEIALVGGPTQREAELRKLIPWFSRARIWVAHLADDGALWAPGGTHVGTGYLQDHLRIRPSLPPDRARFLERMAHVHQGQAQVHAFTGALARRAPVATLALGALIVVVFLLQLMWGGTDYVPAAMRMGALSRASVALGEPWRLVSCTFLHGNLMHVALNLFVLVSLGWSLEAVLGSSRFLLLYAASGIGGSLVSLVFLGDQYSLGASGAIWGLMTAQYVLVLRGKAILPAWTRASMRRGAGQNLALNVLNSFRPGVDFGAHAGGGIVGAVLMGVGLLTVGVPRWAEIPAGEAAPPDREPWWIRAGALLGSAVLLGGLGLALATGQPWALGESPRLERVPIGATGFTIELPVGLTLELQAGSDPAEYCAGDIYRDGVLFDMIVVPVEVGPHEVAEVEATLLAGIGKNDGTTPTVAMHRDADGLLVGSSRYPSGMEIERAARVTPAGIVRVDVLRWPDAPVPWRGLSVRTIRTLR